NPQVTITYERDGVTKDVKVFPALVPTNLRSGDVIREIGLMPAEKMVIGNLSDDSPAIAGGMQKGDEILAVNGQKVFSTAQLNDLINQSGGSPIVFNISRQNKPMDLTVHPARVPRTTPLATITVAAATLDILPIYKANDSADPASPATTAEKLLIWNVDNRNSAFSGLRSGDYLLKVNGQAVTSVQQVVDALAATPVGQTPSFLIDSETTHANLTVPLPATATATVTPSEMITRVGIDGWKDDAAPVHPTPLAQFSHAFNQIFGMLGALFNPHSNIGVQHLSGPIGISRMIYQLSIEDVRLALWFAFIINVNLAILNLLPIPVLDGGHILFFTIARLRRRELPLGVISAAQGICLVLIMSLVLYVFINDSRRWGGEKDLEKEAIHNSYYFLDQENIKFSPSPANPSTPANASGPAASAKS
ncbi:MAG TPA: site-2 protease family protein, partial [Opitutales bacterium]|nr:site-2 protease family protein [Opitutales bacterium]